MQNDQEDIRIPGSMTELREELCKQFAQLRKDPRRIKQSVELSNMAGKIIDTVKTELVAASLNGEKHEIAYLGKGSGIPLDRPSPKRIKPITQ